MKRVFLFATILGLFAISCTKDNSDENLNPTTTIDYTQLITGNYWVYAWYQMDSSCNVSLMNKLDSIIITGDTNINGNIYYKRYSVDQSYVVYLRDSSGYLIDLEGKILFSSNDFSNILRVDTIAQNMAYIEYKMLAEDTSISVPLGTYPALNFRGRVVPLKPDYPHGIQYTYYFYADGLGMIKSSTYYFSNPYLRVERRLKNFGNIEIE